MFFQLPTGLDCFLYILVLECVDIEGPFQYSSQNMNWRLSSQWVPKCQENNGNIFLNIQCWFNALCEMGYQSELSLWQGGTWEEGISVLFFKLYIYWRKIPLVSLHPAATGQNGCLPKYIKNICCKGNQIWKRHVHPNVHRSTVYHSQDMETT